MPLSMTKARTANAEAADHRDERDYCEHHEKPATAALAHTGMPESSAVFPSACPVENLVPVPGERLGRQRGEPSGEQIVFVRAHAITS